MKIAIIGGRDFNDYQRVKDVINDYLIDNDISQWEIISIVSGGAKGADSLAERYAKEFNINMKVFPADWDKYKKAAGYIRNVEIVEYSDIIFAFWDGESKGTKHSIDIATKKNKELHIIKYLKK